MLGQVAALFLLAAARAAPAAAPSTPAAQAAPAAEARTCLECHAALLAGRKPHKPARDGECTSCHAASPGPGKCKSPVSAAWKPAGAPPELCYKCHAKYDDAEFIHTAVKQGKCLGCHDPHAGTADPLLARKRDELCFFCHSKDALTKGDSVHAPVAGGKCLGCHDPHRADYKAEVVEKGNALCLKCHDVKQAGKPGMPRKGQLVDLSLQVVHNPLKKGECADCHLAHASQNAKLLKAAPGALCFKCHAHNDDDKFVHGAVRLGDCATCHQPHASANKGLLTEATTAALCFRCHADDITGRAWVHKPAGEGKCLDCHEPHGADFRFNLKTGARAAACTGCHKGKGETKVRHAVLERDGCTACHDPHGSANALGLVKPVNEVCQGCHPDKADGMHATTFVAGGHAIAGDWDPRRKGRSFSCASCHDPHGSDNPRFFHFGRDAAEMCDGCHGDRTGAHPELKDIHRKPQKPVPVAGASEGKP